MTQADDKIPFENWGFPALVGIKATHKRSVGVLCCRYQIPSAAQCHRLLKLLRTIADLSGVMRFNPRIWRRRRITDP